MSAVILVSASASKTQFSLFMSIEAFCNATVPVAFGNVIVLSAVGSVTAIVVSKLSAVEPSNISVGK